MNTITTKQLRQSMAKVITDLQKGKSVQLSYRRKVIGSLQPVTTTLPSLRPGSPQAVLAFLKQANFGPMPPKLSQAQPGFKQEMARLRDQELSE